MRRVCGSAGFALVVSIGLMVSTPAQARKKVDAGPPVALSDGFRASVEAVRAAFAAGDLVTAQARIGGLAPTSDLENYIAAGLRFEAASKRGDVQAQRIALTDMFKTRSVPPADAPRLRYMAGLYSYYVGNNDDAIAQLNYARTLGYDGIDANLLMADILLRKRKPKEARPLVEQALATYRAAGKPIPAPWYDKAISLAMQGGDWSAVSQLYGERLSVYPSTPNWRSALANIMDEPKLDPQVQLDLFRLQAAVGAMASERDYQNYAMLASGAGASAEAQTVIAAGRAAGKLPVTQAATAKLLLTAAPKAKKDIAALPALAKKAGAAKDGAAALAVADSYYSMAQYPQAVEYYRMAASKGGVDAARVNTRLGIALARSGDYVGGGQALSQVTGGAWSGVAGLWRLWVGQRAGQSAAVAPASASATAS